MNTLDQSLPSSSLYLATLIKEKCESFVDFHLWPRELAIDVDLWLSNFQDGEMEHAYHLLNAFMYFSEPLVDQLFQTAFHNLSRQIRAKAANFSDSQQKWQEFCDRLIITHVTGEIPNPSDSGGLFARKARQILGIEEDRIYTPAQALSLLDAYRSMRHR